MNDSGYMKRALHLASLTCPDILGERVGSIVVSGGEIVGCGNRRFASQFYGNPDYDMTVLHAERVAIEIAGSRARGATIYTTIEPCMPLETEGNGEFPSCSDLIVSRGLSTVVYGMQDPNPDIDGRGRDYLEDKGVEVVHLPGFEEMILPLLRSNNLARWKATRGRHKDWRYPKYGLASKDNSANRRIALRREEIRIGELMSESMR